MFKLLFCSLALVPCFILSALFAPTKPLPNLQATSFDDYFVLPALAKIEQCESTQLGVFFHQDYVTAHAAEYVVNAIHLSEACGHVNFIIEPVRAGSDRFDKKTQAMVAAQAEELRKLLQAHGAEATIDKMRSRARIEGLSENGQNAILKIVIGEPQQI